LNDLRIASGEPSAFVLKADSVAVSLGHEQGIVESIALEFHGGEIGRDVAKISAQKRAALERPFEEGEADDARHPLLPDELFDRVGVRFFLGGCGVQSDEPLRTVGMEGRQELGFHEIFSSNEPSGKEPPGRKGSKT